MAFPFSVGESTVQSTLDWVAQPPPAQGRDMHAVRFRLQKGQDAQRNPQFSGLLFFRPPGTGQGPVGVRPGLDGFGSLLVTQSVCRSLLDPNTAVPPARLVRVFLAFRQQQSGPANIVATLTFMDGDLVQLPTQTFNTVEFSHVEMAFEGGDGQINMDPPAGWSLLLGKTTVLLRRPEATP